MASKQPTQPIQRARPIGRPIVDIDEELVPVSSTPEDYFLPRRSTLKSLGHRPIEGESTPPSLGEPSRSNSIRSEPKQGPPIRLITKPYRPKMKFRPRNDNLVPQLQELLTSSIDFETPLSDDECDENASEQSKKSLPSLPSRIASSLTNQISSSLSRTSSVCSDLVKATTSPIISQLPEFPAGEMIVFVENAIQHPVARGLARPFNVASPIVMGMRKGKAVGQDEEELESCLDEDCRPFDLGEAA